MFTARTEIGHRIVNSESLKNPKGIGIYKIKINYRFISWKFCKMKLLFFVYVCVYRVRRMEDIEFM